MGEKFYQNLEVGSHANPTLNSLNRLAGALDAVQDPERLREALERVPG